MSDESDMGDALAGALLRINREAKEEFIKIMKQREMWVCTTHPGCICGWCIECGGEAHENHCSACAPKDRCYCDDCAKARR